MLTSSTLGDPPPPKDDPDWTQVTTPNEDALLPEDMIERNHVPTLEEMGIEEDIPGQKGRYVWQGGIVCRLRCLGGRKGCLLATTDTPTY